MVAGTDIAGVDLSLAPGGGIAGLVTDSTGFPVGGATVSVFRSTGELSATSVTDALGQDPGVTVPAGSFRARAEPSATHGAEIFSELPLYERLLRRGYGRVNPGDGGNDDPQHQLHCGELRRADAITDILATGVDTRTYRQVLSVSGGTGPMAFRVIDGVLPLGMTLGAASGVIEGTPAVSGRYAFTVGAVDAPVARTSRAYTLDIQECAFTLSPASATVPAAGGTVTVTIVGTCGPQTVTATSFVTVQSNTAGQVVFTYRRTSTTRHEATISRSVAGCSPCGRPAWRSQPPFGVLDAPADGAQVSGSIALGGWALDDLEVEARPDLPRSGGRRAAVQIFIGTAVFVAGARPDVPEGVSDLSARTTAAGWGFLILTNMLPNQGNGTFRIYAYADDAEGARDARWAPRPSSSTTPPRRCRSGRSIRRGRARPCRERLSELGLGADAAAQDHPDRRLDDPGPC